MKSANISELSELKNNVIIKMKNFIDNKDGGSNPGGKNHTYVISGTDLHYINSGTDNVEVVGSLTDTLIGLDKVLQIPTDMVRS